MRELIIERLREIERTENVRILFAVESVGRAWGFASPDSDYDVRFVYVRPLEHYLKLEKTRDVIEYPINDLLDINGWDLSKTLQLLHSANPTLFEWISSPIVYLKTSCFEEFSALAKAYFSSKKGLYHYISMAEGNYREYLKTDMVKAKKYFYVLRPVLACKWIMEKGTPPPMLFSELVNSQLDKELVPAVQQLLDIKMNSPEIKMIPRVQIINDYLDENIASIKEQISSRQDYDGRNENSWEKLNTFFLKVVNGG